MGYRALLFCPDKKIARTVTQVLSELEFSIEPCAEPFAAVKKLMGEHFDAVVVDCDNEQNATLLFKSARNSTSNQTSLAVAVVEGQAGVAKAFRIGANLVLTKPINVEQAKGTLRVARGLLRKGDPTKTAGAPTVAPVASTSPAATPPAPLRPAPRPAVTGSTPSRPSASAPAMKPSAGAVSQSVAPAVGATASSTPSIQDEEILDIGAEDVAAPSVQHSAAPAPPAFQTAHAAEIQSPKAVGSMQTSAWPASQSSGGPGSGAASAPARARTTPSAGEQLFETAAEPAKRDEVFSSATAPELPSFTFGGANEASETTGGSKKIFIAIAAALVVAIGLYAGWAQFHEKASSSSSVPAQETLKPEAPKPTSGTATPASQTAKAQPGPMSSAPAPSATTSQPEDIVIGNESAVSDSHQSGGEKHPSASEKHGAAASTAGVAKPSASTTTPARKGTSNTEPAAPLVVKSGTAAVGHGKPAAASETEAPSMLGIAPAGSGGSLTNLVADAGNAPQPVLQTVNISQGVSQGLLIKKVQPIYPPAALRMHVEGSVQLLATIGKTGNMAAVKILSGDTSLARAAQEAVKQWKYKPYYLNGEPVEIQTQVTINFKLPK